MGWEAAILEALGKWHSSPGSVWVVEMPRWWEWWSQVPPRNDEASPRKQLSLGQCVVLACTEESSLIVWVCFRSYCCCSCCWENSNRLGFPRLETLPCTVALGPKTALLTSVWTITEERALDHHLTGIVPKGESAPFLGMPSTHGGMRKQGRWRGLKKACAAKGCNCKCLAKRFSRGWNKGLIRRIDRFIERGDIAEEKAFPEQPVFQVVFVCCREASKTLR